MENIRAATAFDVFDEARLLGEHTDMIIKSDDREFQVHKIIMCGCSTYFRDLFSNKWNSQPQHVCEIQGISKDIMSLIIEYAYKRSVLIITQENVMKLLVAADMTVVLGLVDACCQFLESQLCPENCIGFWTFTEDLFYCSKLRCKAKHYILQHFEEVLLEPKEFLELSLNQLEEIIDEDELNVKQEEVVYEAILSWINHDPENREQHIAVLLPKVRLGLMTSEYLFNNVKRNALVMENQACLPVVKALFELGLSKPTDSIIHELIRPRLPSSILLAIGGMRGDDNLTNDIEAYDVKADCWVSVTQENERPRAYHGTAVLDEFVYSIGGYDGVEVLNSVRKFNLITQTWQEVAPMYERRNSLSVAVLDGLIYAIGGVYEGQWLKTVERYDPNTDQWTMMSPMNKPRCEASATSLQGRIYICGGYNGVECFDSAETFNPETNQWTLIAPMSSRRSDLRVIAYEGLVYAVGGFDGISCLRTAEVYNPLTDTWREVKSMTSLRCNFGIEVVDGKLFVIGGFDHFGTTRDVAYYDPETDKWFDALAMPIPRRDLCCCVVTGLPNMAMYSAPRDAIQSEDESDSE